MINSYDIVYDANFTNSCNEYNEKEESTQINADITNFITEEINITDIIYKDSIKVENSSKIIEEFNYYTEYFTEDDINTEETKKTNDEILYNITDIINGTNKNFEYPQSTSNNSENTQSITDIINGTNKNFEYPQSTSNNSENSQSITDIINRTNKNFEYQQSTSINSEITQSITNIINRTNKNFEYQQSTSINSEITQSITNIINVTNKNFDNPQSTSINSEITQSIIDKLNLSELITEYPKIQINEEIINKTKEEIINNITDIISDKEIGKNYEIKGDDFTIIMRPTNSKYFSNSNIVDFDECEIILRNHYNISNSSIITFFQMEIYNDDKNALYNQIKYFTYDEKKQELDLTLCKDIETKIRYSIKSSLDESALKDFSKLGIDILNIKDDFLVIYVIHILIQIKYDIRR